MPKKRERFLDLISVAKADGEITEDEIAFLVYYAGQAGISVNEAITIIEDFKESITQFLSAGSKLQQEQFVVDLITMAMVDGELSIREVEKCKSICTRSGLSEVIVDFYIEEMKYTRKVLNDKVVEWKEAAKRGVDNKGEMIG